VKSHNHRGREPRGFSHSFFLSLFLLVVSSHVALAGITMADMDVRKLQKIDYFATPLVVSGPEITGFDGPEAIFYFETSVPTPPAVVRYGPLFGIDGIEKAAYRKVAIERQAEGESTHHRIHVDVSKLESNLYDVGLVPDGGGVVAYRLEVYDPEYGSVRTYDRRFRYTRAGSPKTGTYAPGVTMTLGPFVDLVGPDSFVVSWGTDVESRGSVTIGKMAYVDDDEAREHALVIPGLAPSTTYSYRVRYGEGTAVTRSYDVTTAPPAGDEGFRFAFASDSRAGAGGGEQAIEGVNHAGLTSVLEGARAKGADFVLFGGDLIDGYTSSRAVFEGQLESWKRAAGQVAASLPIYEGMGNHEQLGEYYALPDPEFEDKRIIMFRDREESESAEAVFSAAFTNPDGSAYGVELRPEERTVGGIHETGPDYGESVYSFNHGNCHFVSLNSNYWFTGLQMGEGTKRYPSDRGGTAIALDLFGGSREGYVLPNQLIWLDEDLRATQADPAIDWVFVFTHEPAFPNGGHLYDAMFWGDAGKGHEGGLNDPSVPLGDVVDMRNRLWSILSRHDKVVAFMSGDEHNYSRTLIDADVDPSYPRPVWHIVSGGAGAPFYVQDSSVPWADKVEAFWPVNHYCVFGVADGRVSLEVYSTSGVLIDSVDDFSARTSAVPPE
jgi:hypothetical protein